MDVVSKETAPKTPESITETPIDVLIDKHKNTSAGELVAEYRRLATDMYEISVQLRELSIVEGFKRMTPEQQELQRTLESDMKFLRETGATSKSNIVGLQDGDLFENMRTTDKDVKYSFKMFHDMQEAVDHVESLPDDVDTGTLLLAPLFLAI